MCNCVNVLHLSRTMGQGGAEKIVYQLCKDNCMAKQCVASCGGSYESELEKLGIKHFLIPDMEKKNIKNTIRTIHVLSFIIKSEKIDILHTHHRMAAFYARVLQIRFPNLKHVYTAHNVFLNHIRLLQFALQKATVVACGNTVKENLINDYKLDRKTIVVIYNSVEKPIKISEKNEILETEIQNNKYLIGSIGRISEQKGFDIFIKAIKIVCVQYPYVKAVIIGDGDLRHQIETLVKDLKLEENVIFLGFQKNVFALIKQMQFVVLASRWEGFALTPIEVFSVERTIIVSDIPNNQEIVSDGINGLYFKKNDPEDLANRIVELVDNDDLRFCLQHEAKKTYEDRFSYKSFINAYMSVYQNITGVNSNE